MCVASKLLREAACSQYMLQICCNNDVTYIFIAMHLSLFTRKRLITVK